MKSNTAAIQKYALFGSRLRGEACLERYLEQLLSEMETTSNLQRMAENLQQDWMIDREAISLLLKTFGGKSLKPVRGAYNVLKVNARMLNRPAFRLNSRKMMPSWDIIPND